MSDAGRGVRDAPSIALSEEKETLLIPLWCKAAESGRPDPILRDPWAREILARVDYDFASLAIPRKTVVTVAMRAKKLDDVARAFLSTNPEAVVLHLGCGLDARCERVPHPEADWLDVDYPDVIELRRELFEPSSRYSMVGSPVTEPEWLEAMEVGGRPGLVIAEGLLMYLDDGEVRALVRRVREALPSGHLAFDGFSTLTARHAGRHPSLRKTGAEIKWGIDDPRALESWGQGIRLVEEWAFSDSEDLAKLEWGYRLGFRIASAFSGVRRAHRILRYDLG